MRTRATFSEAIVLVAIVVTLLPIGWLIVSSFQFTREILTPGLSAELTLHNYAEIFGARSTFPQQFVNSLIIVVSSTFLCVVIGALAAYSLSKLKWRKVVTGTLLGIMLLIQIVPPMTIVPSLFVTLVQLNLLNTRTGLVLFHTVFHLPFAVLLLKVYFDALPEELRESALVDGASEFRGFVSVMLPLAAPGIAAVTTLTAILSWNEFLLGLTLTRGPEAAPLTVAIAVLIQEYGIRYGEMTAAGTVAAVPIIVLAILAHRHIVAGLTGGSVKG